MAYKNKEDKKKYMKQYRIDNKEYRKEYNKQWSKNNPEYIKNYGKQWRKDNKEHLKKYKEQWRKDNPKYMEEYKEQWYKDNPDYDKQNYKNNKEKRKKQIQQYYINNKEKMERYKAMWRKTEKGKANNQRNHIKRWAIEKDTINTLTSEEWLDILKEYDYKCAYCGCDFDENTLPTKDHIIPISKGGHNVKENIVPACRSCNSKKGNKIIQSYSYI